MSVVYRSLLITLKIFVTILIISTFIFVFPTKFLLLISKQDKIKIGKEQTDDLTKSFDVVVAGFIIVLILWNIKRKSIFFFKRQG